MKTQRINELARELNNSSSEWLDAWNAATTAWATTEDRLALAEMAWRKKRLSEELAELLSR